jgi:16S rRNA (adenine1518-N6/adenine1519-N6)-dimethyltransferase
MEKRDVRAKKWLGQHFLRDLNFARKLAALIPAGLPAKTLLEVGPGTGSLTQFLPVDTFEQVLLVEVDKESVAYLNEHYNRLPFRILENDFLKMPLDEVMQEGCAVVGNYPYNISSQIFFRILEHYGQVPFSAGMVQKEVGVRLASGPGNKDYGILSVLLQTWYKVRVEFKVPPGAFQPPPKVDSVVVSFTRNKRASLPFEWKFMMRIVKEGFNQRRKTLRNALKSSTPPNFDHPYLDKRAEQLGVEEFIELCVAIKGLKAE